MTPELVRAFMSAPADRGDLLVLFVLLAFVMAVLVQARD